MAHHSFSLSLPLSQAFPEKNSLFNFSRSVSYPQCRSPFLRLSPRLVPLAFPFLFRRFSAPVSTSIPFRSHWHFVCVSIRVGVRICVSVRVSVRVGVPVR